MGVGGREFAGFDGVDGAAGDDGSGGVEEVGFGFGVGGGEFVGVAKEVEEIAAESCRCLKINRFTNALIENKTEPLSQIIKSHTKSLAYIIICFPAT